MHARASAIAAVCGALCAISAPAAAQHEHHGVAADRPARLDSLSVRAERDAVRLRSGATVVDTRATSAAGRSAQAIEQGEILPAFTGELALTQRLAGDRGRVTLRLDGLEGDPQQGGPVPARPHPPAKQGDTRTRSTTIDHEAKPHDLTS